MSTAGAKPIAASQTKGIRWVSGRWSSPKVSVGMRPGSVEVAKIDVADPVGHFKILQCALEGQVSFDHRAERALGMRFSESGTISGSP